jgi:hypothetical protein
MHGQSQGLHAHVTVHCLHQNYLPGLFQLAKLAIRTIVVHEIPVKWPHVAVFRTILVLLLNITPYL